MCSTMRLSQYGLKLWNDSCENVVLILCYLYLCKESQVSFLIAIFWSCCIIFLNSCMCFSKLTLALSF